jgi:hypothetical protein
MADKKVPKKFKQVGPGEWQQPRMKNYFLQCCDCDLIHRMNFRVVIDRKGVARVQLQAFRVKRVQEA